MWALPMPQRSTRSLWEYTPRDKAWKKLGRLHRSTDRLKLLVLAKEAIASWRKISLIKVDQRTIKLVRHAAAEGVILIGIVNTIDRYSRVFEQSARLLCPAKWHS